jgi:hypothetical protein
VSSALAASAVAFRSSAVIAEPTSPETPRSEVDMPLRNSLLFAGVLTACGAETPSTPRVPSPRAAAAVAEYAVELSEDEQAALMASVRAGIVVVATRPSLRFLHGCKPPLGYRYAASAPKTSEEYVRTQDDLRREFLLAKPELRAAMAHAGTLSVHAEVVGRYEAGRSLTDDDYFDGDCEGATHWISAVEVGAFDVVAEGAPPAKAAPSVVPLPVGESAAQDKTAPPASPPERAPLLARGSEEACARAFSATEPPAACSAVVRMFLRPLPHKPCPRLSVLRGDTCRSDAEGVAPPGRQPFEVSSSGPFPPGLAPVQVEAFVRPKEAEVAKACWDGRFESYRQGHVEYGVAVDPGGNVIPPAPGALSSASAEVRSDSGTSYNLELARCVEGVVNRWRFPRATTPTFIVVNFDFGR